jgi:hypothetical protein
VGDLSLQPSPKDLADDVSGKNGAARHRRKLQKSPPRNLAHA